ncbi:MAG: hypothetical protein WCF90_11300 [Methanomicrobiales archaeon]
MGNSEPTRSIGYNDSVERPVAGQHYILIQIIVKIRIGGRIQ